MSQTARFQETLRRLAIAPVAGLGRVVSAAPDVATANHPPVTLEAVPAEALLC
jgi:hypothetical protein